MLLSIEKYSKLIRVVFKEKSVNILHLTNKKHLLQRATERVMFQTSVTGKPKTIYFYSCGIQNDLK